MPRWLNPQWFRDHGVFPDPPPRTRGPEFLSEQLDLDLSVSILPALLRYEDRNSMAFSIESRVPFLTPKFVAFARSLPNHYHIAPDGTSKSVFRQAMRGLVPDRILDRTDKIGFATPEEAWLRELRPWIEKTLDSEVAHSIPAIDVQEMKQQWQSFLANRGSFDFRFWRWVNFIQWVDRRNILFS